jgi:nicotinamidase-related amidase
MTQHQPDRVAVLFLDLQEDIVNNSKTLSVDRLRRTSGVLARLCALHDIPAFLSIVSQGGPFLSDVLAPLGDVRQRARTQTSAFSDRELVTALRGSGCNRLVLAGVASEVVVQRTALDALAEGYTVLLAVDACGGVDARTEQAAWQRVAAAGAMLTSVVTLAAELAGDFTTPRGRQTIGLMYEAIG